jgi:rhamnosyltransferase
MAVQSVCAVVITYKPRPAFVNNVAAVAGQVDRVVIVDNGSSAETERQLQRLEDRLGCKVIRNYKNVGVAVALNLGVKHAMEAGFDWVCTFDQDSLVSEGFISKMLEAYQRAPYPENVALVAPSYVDHDTGVEVRLRRASNGEILAGMTSGSMIPSKAIRKLGWFDETLFIDAVDKEFSLRARQQGMVILQSPAVLLHSLGRTTYHQILGLRFGTTNHPVGRRYYIARDSLRVLMRYASDWTWAWQESRWLLLDAAKILLIEDDKWKKFRAMAVGIAAALTGKMGKQIEL